ncbi:competence protein ComGA [Bombilactobacillus bombi]|uniref:Competence protein ComGA n=2 Tax=Bombilactobacillus bombi TaxID=1303590 RepID=A0A3R6W9J6_9LACO|nr:competence protein ComGA [Bombilactobacillus bombi]
MRRMKPEQYVKRILDFACQRDVSDIFFLPQKDKMIIKMREIDGIHDYQLLEADFAVGVINYLKFTSDMDISEHRRPQAGARNFNFRDQVVNLRLSSLGNYSNKESLVIRLIYPLRQLTQNELNGQQWQDIMNQRGLILFSGPTGSGKTTAMYQLTKKYSQHKIVLAIEDPVEVIEPDFLQIQVNKRAQMSYADLIRTSLRHRPDILILGEIRDEESSEMAIRAALSGHLVISTVHARNKFAVIGRMMELGISQRELHSVLNCVIYQRLILQTTGIVKAYRDVLLEENLSQAIQIPQSNYSDWQTMLQIDYKKGLLDEQTYQKYKTG